MNKIGRARLLLLITTIMIVSILYVFRSQYLHQLTPYTNYEIYSGISYTGVSSREYLVWNPQCRIPEIQLWDKSIRKYFKSSSLLRCSKRPLLTSIVSYKNGTNLLKVEKDAVNLYKKNRADSLQCCFSEITRISESPNDYDLEADNKFRYSKCQDFDQSVLFENMTEFIRVICRVKGKVGTAREVYRDAHALVPILPSALEKMKEIRTRASIETRDNIGMNERLNVMILGIDSVSRLNFRRMMPETFKYLTQNEWLELSGYTKIADNTLPNLMAILSGRNMTDLKHLCFGNRNKSIDDCPYIWKKFSDVKYVTAYAEDTPNISTFNYLKTGFVEKPTDYYLRPFMLAVHSSLLKKKVFGLPVCVGPVSPVDHILNYARRFLNTFNDYNHFSLFWMNSLSHNDPSMAQNMDRRTLHFLRDLWNLGSYHNTVILFLSDHGTRFGDFRHSFIGYYEERLPFIFIWFPEWFKKRYPHIYANMVINQKRLTCPYDVHLTLLKILRCDYTESDMTGSLPVCPTCRSLFERLPWNRGCEDAGIHPSWCMCDEFKPLKTNEEIISRVGIFISKTVDKKTKEIVQQERLNDSICATWKFRKVVRAHEMIPVKDNSNSPESRVFMVLVELDPGKTKFEAAIEMTVIGRGREQFAVKSSPSRIDGYSKFSECVNSPSLKYYCYCSIFTK